MCTYAEHVYKLHYVCVDCRWSCKRSWSAEGELCTRCRRPMACAGHDFAAPRKGDDRRWSAVAAVLAAGLRYEGFEPCGCGREPKYRPRTGADVRARRRIMARTALPEHAALALRDPSDALPAPPDA
ncbi:hypothetical protein EDD29_3252 [Actinocorallia herbida]|uniref:Uncharacterized protein n=1 Tax=Actinocorallia herbida TaxID=58109 RepID=A0A3N1CWR0_9ACTN|nr:hypothetical protein [Actinocorallia herbida]ROO85704.1 hypothetical protein EDD29_3252 [Actinocorallia herbida]